MSFFQLNASELASRAHKAVLNTVDYADMLAVMTEHGYEEPELREVLAHANELFKLSTDRLNAKGTRVGTVATFKEAREDFHSEVYMPHIRVARVIFKDDPAAATRLGLKGDRARALGTWIEQARCFYDNALASPDLLNRLATRRILQAHLEEASAQLETLAREASAKEDVKGLAIDATENRDKLARDLALWLSAYREIARVAFADQPAMLVRLGFRARRTRKRTRPKDEETNHLEAGENDVTDEAPGEDGTLRAPGTEETGE